MRLIFIVLVGRVEQVVHKLYNSSAFIADSCFNYYLFFIYGIINYSHSGEKGYAYTLVTDADKEMAGHLVRNLESVNQVVPNALLQLALKSAWFKASRLKEQVHGGGNQHQRTGLGYKPRSRPGIGALKFSCYIIQIATFKLHNFPLLIGFATQFLTGSSATSSDTSRALSFTTIGGNKQKSSNALDLAKSSDGSTNRLQAMKAAFKACIYLRFVSFT